MFHLLQHWDTHRPVDLKGLAVAVGLASTAASLTGVVMGVIAGPMGWGFSMLALLVGLAAGLTARLVRFESYVASCSVAVSATLLGLAVHGMVVSATTSRWSAQQEVSREELDFTIQKYIAGQLCRQRRVVAFGYDEVPRDIKNEAAGKLARMSTDEKNALVNETFGKRINERDSAETGFLANLSCGVVILGAVALSIGALMLQWRRHREM